MSNQVICIYEHSKMHLLRLVEAKQTAAASHNVAG